MRRPDRDYYGILVVDRDADELTLKAAYRKLALQYHPDRNRNREAEVLFKEASEAYRVLIDPIQRMQYDLRLAPAPKPWDAPPVQAPARILPRLLRKTHRPLYAAAAAGTGILMLASVYGLGKALASLAGRGAASPAPLSAVPPPTLPLQREAYRPQAIVRTNIPGGVIKIVRGPRPVTQTPIEYPADALHRGVSGLVELQFTIAANGTVQDTQVLSGDAQFASSVLDAVRQWTFAPMRVNRRPAPMSSEMAIAFNANK